MVRCSYCNLNDKAQNPSLGVQASPNTSPSLRVSVCKRSQSQSPEFSWALLPLGPNQSSTEFLPSFQQKSQTERKEREGEKVGQEMPFRSQELEWFMCAGMLREEDVGLEESKGPGLRIDLLSRRITKWVGIWLRESFLKGIASFVFPSGMLTSTCRFDVT